MKLTLFKNIEVDLFFSDHSSNSKLIAKRLLEVSLFNKVCHIENKEKEYCLNYTKLMKLKQLLILNFGKINELNLNSYDEIIFFNYSFMIYEIADYFKKINKKVEWSRFEEGIFSYDNNFLNNKILLYSNKIRKFTGRTIVTQKIKKYYCFFPQIKKNIHNQEIIKIPSVTENNEEFVKIVNCVFDFKELEIKQKYIFFSSSSDIDGNAFGETEFVINLAQKVGAENLLVKMHPRDTRKVYEDFNITVMKNSYIPWEVFQLNGNFNNKILLTVHSGAFMSISALLNGDTKGYFLYPMFEKNPTPYFQKKTKEIELFLSEIHKNELAQNIISSHNINDIIK